MSLIALIHWFNPLAWYSVRRLEDAAEWACDDEASRSGGTRATEYAKALLTIVESSKPTPQVVPSMPAIKGGSLSKKIRRVVARPPAPDSTVRLGLAVAAMLLLLMSHLIRIEFVARAASPLDAGLSMDSASREPTRPNETNRSEAIFARMRDGEYREAWFPKLQWSDIPALLKYIDTTENLRSFPHNPFSSQSQAECAEGIAAMWLIDGDRCGNRFPSLNPMLSSKTIAEEQIQNSSAAAFRRWWQRVKTWPANEARRIDPLRGTGISWYGGHPRMDLETGLESAIKQTAPGNMRGDSQKVVSVSDEGSHYFVMTRTESKTGGTMYKVGPKRDEPIWTTTGWYAPVVIALRDGTMMRLSEWFLTDDEQNNDSNARIEFYRKGKMVRAHRIGDLFGNRATYLADSFSLRYKMEGRVWINAKATGYGHVQPYHIEFDLKTGERTREIEVSVDVP